MKTGAVLALLAAPLWIACSKKHEADSEAKTELTEPTQAPSGADKQADVTPDRRWYRVEVLGEDNAELRVIFQLGVDWPLQPESQAQVVNGVERFAWTMHCDQTRHCSIVIPVYAAGLELDFPSQTGLSGEWKRDPVAYKSGAPVRGVKIDGPELRYRLEAGEPPSADFSGEWLVDSEEFGRSRAKFEQDQEGGITGTITPKGVGDARFLAGRVTGKVAHLSTFDGQRAYAVRMQMDTELAVFEGSWLSLDFYTRSFTGRRAEAPSLLDELYVDEVASKDRRVTIPELAALRGKPVIVDMFGTWCPTCLDTVPTLVSLHDEFAPKGLEILSIAFEMTEDEAFARQRLKAFDERFHIKWNTVLRLGEQFESLFPPEIEPSGFPITLFVNRDGTVHRMNTGFVSPAAEQDHKAIVEAFHTWTEEIMASPAATD